MSNKNKSIIWLLLFIVVIMFGITIATYAYLSVKVVREGNFEVDITSKGVDTLIMDNETDFKIVADDSNFGFYNGDNVIADSGINVTLNTTNNEAKYCYNLEVSLPNNIVFNYSKDDKTPELVLDVMGSNNNANYDYLIQNMDITTATGNISIPTSLNGHNYKHEIYTAKNIEVYRYYKGKITFVWFDDQNQEINNFKSYNASIKANITEC